MRACSVSSRQSLRASLRREFSAFSSCVVALTAEDEALAWHRECSVLAMYGCSASAKRVTHAPQPDAARCDPAGNLDRIEKGCPVCEGLFHLVSVINQPGGTFGGTSDPLDDFVPGRTR